MINFFAILLIIFIGILLLVFKKRSFKKLINKRNIYSIKLNTNNKLSSNNNSFLYNHEEKKYSVFYKNSQRKKMTSLAISSYLTVLKIMGEDIGNRPLLMYALILGIAGVQLFSFGLLSELLIRTYHESQSRPIYRIRSINSAKHY